MFQGDPLIIYPWSKEWRHWQEKAQDKQVQTGKGNKQDILEARTRTKDKWS